MIKLKMMIIAMVAGGVLFNAPTVQAHCDSLDGPVAKAAHKALQTGNVNPVLAYAPAAAEAEIRVAFERSRKVRGLNVDARALADHAFLETIEHALRERLAHVRNLQKASLEPKTAAEVQHARERISAELGFVTFAETIRQAAHGKGAEHHVD